MLDKRARETVEIYENYRDQRAGHYDEAQTDRDFVVNKQWTEAEAAELQERGHAPLVINRIYPIIMQEIAIMTANNVEYRVLAREDGDVRVAKVGNQLLSYIQDRNNFGLLFSKVIYDFLVCGTGWGYVFQDNYTSEGKEIGLDHIPYDDVYPDPYARRQDMYDAENMLISKLITEGMFQRLYPENKEAWAKAKADYSKMLPGQTGMYNESNVKEPKDIYDPQRNLARIIERYTISKIAKVKVVQPANGDSKIYLKEIWAELVKKPEVQSAISSGAYNPIDIWDDQSFLEVSLGDSILYQRAALPSKRIPVIPFVNFHNGTPYGIGDVRFLRGIQREINKRRSLLIAHATTSTASKLLVEKGSIDDVEEVERKNARPGAVIEYETGYNKPEQSQPMPLSNGLFQLENEAKYDLEYLAGMFAISQGSTRDAPETFRATLAIEEFANRRLNLKMRSVTNALSIMGSVAWEFMQKIYDYDKVIRIVNSEDNEEEIKLGLVDNASEADIKKVLNVTTGVYDCKAVSGSTMASNRWAELQEYKELLQMGAIDQTEFLKKTNIFDREGILKRTGQLQQAGQQIEQLAQMIEELQKQVNGRDSKLESAYQTLVKQKIEIQELKKQSSKKDEKSNEGE